MIGKLPSYEILRDMAENNPSELEKLRTSLSEEIINSASKRSQKRLRGIQFKIDATRENAKNPLAACIAISDMMQQSFENLRNALNSVENIHLDADKHLPKPNYEAYSNKEKPKQSAQIIQFPGAIA